MLPMISLERTVTVRDRRFLLRVEASHDPADYRKYDELREDIWGFPDDHLSSARNMMCENVFHEGGSLFLGVFEPAGGDLVGFCYGFVGVRDKAVGFRDVRNLRFYAQYTGVRKSVQSYGLGVRLKEFQRDVVRGLLGVSTIICTFDPLTGVNAERNIHHFGMDVLEYRPATYGEYGGHLNRLDVPTDRFLMSWDLDKAWRPPDYDLDAALASIRPIRVLPRRIVGKSGPVDLESVEGTDPGASGEVLLVPIPLDFYKMLHETDVEDDEVRNIPVRWRMAAREVLQGLFARGYRVIDFRKALPGLAGNFYVLARPSPPKP
jgi:predicted GNAT superfamily acetyltransferase